ncbi:MAG: MFS transporter [Candidatus Zipacnadales bacterium]
MRSWLLSSALASVYTAATTGAYSTGYALFLGASNAQVGLLSAAPAWGHVLQFFSPLLIERRPRRKTLCLVAYAMGYSVWLLIALIPLVLAAPLRPHAMILFVALGSLAIAFAAPASSSWLSDLLPSQVRARFVARQQSTIAAVGLAASLIAGRYLDCFPEGEERNGFITLFVIAVMFGLAAVIAWAYVAEPPKAPAPQLAARELVTLPFRHVNVRRFTLFAAGRSLVVMIAAPFFTVYMLENLKIPYSQIALFSGINTIAMIVANPVWAYLADKFGHKPVLQLAGFGLAAVPVTWFFTTPSNYLYVTPLLMLWAGAMSGGVILTQLNLLMKIAPQANRSAYMGFHAAAVNVAVAIGSMTGGALGDLFRRCTPFELYGWEMSNLHLVFAISAVGRVLSMFLLRRVREAGAERTRDMLASMGRGRMLSTVWNLWRMAHSGNPETKAHAVRALGDTHSRLVVDELIQSLDDSDREVRREAARALSVIGDARAVAPLIAHATDEASGIVAEAIWALGHIDAPESREFLIRLLESEQASLREMAAAALGILAPPEAAEPLERLLERETQLPVLLAAARALSKTGRPQALGKLLELMATMPHGLPRRELANAVGDLLSKPGQFYKLLQADPIRQEELAERMLRRSASLIAHLRGETVDDRAYVRDHISRALERFTIGDYGSVIRELLQGASWATLIACRGEPKDGRRPRSTLQKFIAADEQLALSHAALKGLSVKSGYSSPGREEALLAIFAFYTLADHLAHLRSSASTH